MTKNQFRIIVISSIVFALLGGACEYLFPNDIAEQAYELVYELEGEPSNMETIALVSAAVILVIYSLVSLSGLLFFKSWGRAVYLAGFILVFPLYPFFGVSVSSGLSQMFYDASMISSGAILALLYFSPVSEYFKK